MCTPSEKLRNSLQDAFTKGLILLLLLLPGFVVAQFAPVRINIAVTPPYSTKLSDYTNNPNKVVVTLQNFTMDGVPLQVYLRCEISGASGTSIFTDPNWRPAAPIVLQPGMPFLLNVNHIQEVFGSSALVYTGISEQEILYGNGLPEDDYVICISAHEYNTGQLLSDEPPFGCSAPFSVTNIEAPVVMQPFCHESISPVYPQSIVISWTMPAGVTPIVQYRLRMVEVSPSNHDVNDAMLSQPTFFETTVTGNVFLYGPAQPSLVEGKTYAFMISAVDPMGQLVFRNGGHSEVCSFTWGQSVSISDQIADGLVVGPVIPTFPPDFEMAPPTTISGRLLVKYPANPFEPLDVDVIPIDPVVIPFPAAPIGGNSDDAGTSDISEGSINFSYAGINHMGMQLGGNVNNHGVGYSILVPDPEDQEVYPDLYGYGWPLVTKMNSQKHIFSQTENLTWTKPLPNTRIRLMARFAFMNDLGEFGMVHPEYGGANPLVHGIDMKGAYRGDANKYVNVPLDETTTDENGNYSFDFNLPFWTGYIMTTQLEHAPPAVYNPNPMDEIVGSLVFPGVDFQNIVGAMAGMPTGGVNAGGQQVMSLDGAVMIEGEFGYMCLKIEVVNQKFASPDIDIFAMPGDMLQVPDQVAKLKTYNLTVEVRSDDTPKQFNTPNKALPGANVRLFRKWDKVGMEVPLIVDFEGQRLETKTESSKGEFKDVAFERTNGSGLVRIENLVRHAWVSDYFIDISTRNFDAADTVYENTFFNYRDIFDEIPVTDQTNAIQSFSSRVIYNHQYPGPAEVVRTYHMQPLPPEIKGRVMAQTNLENTGLAGVNVILLNQSGNGYLNDYQSFINSCYGNQEASTVTNGSGFFRFKDLPVNTSGNDPIFRRVMVRPQLLQQKIIPAIGPPFPDVGRKPDYLNFGELKDMREIYLEELDMLPGYVEDEDGQAVAAWIKTSQSNWYKTERVMVSFNPLNPSLSEWREEFSVPYDAQGGTQIQIKPLSSQYFPVDTIFLPTGQPAEIKVYKRLHRPVVIVTNSQNQPIANAVVKIGEHEAITNANGRVWMKFAAASDQFVLRIEAPEGYADFQGAIEIPVSADWTQSTYILQSARSIQGLITEEQSGAPLGGAMIFAELISTNGLPLYVETTSNAQGQYILSGIPYSLKEITVQVAKPGNMPSYVGASRVVTFPVQMHTIVPPQNFTLQRLDEWDMSKLWGFPIVVTKLNNRFIPGTTTMATLLSGYFVNLPGTGSFQPLESDFKIPFNNIRIAKGDNNRPEPVNETIQTDVLEVPITMAGNFTGKLLNYTQPSGNHPVINILGFPKKKIEMDKIIFGMGGGRIRGQVKLDLASFELVHQFSGALYVGSDTISGKATVFSTNMASQLLADMHVFSLNNSLQPIPVRNFSVFNFDASSTLAGASLSNGTIRLPAILHARVPGGGAESLLDLKVNAGHLLITDTDIRFQQGAAGQLSFDLDKWKVTSTAPWRFDINEDAIVLDEVLIITGQGVDARVKNMKIRPDGLSEGNISLTGGLTLGGIADLELSGNIEPMFNYDAGVGHYRISLVGENGQPAGRVRNLQHCVPNQLEIQTIGMLSNNEDILTIDQYFTFYNVLPMEANSIMTAPGYFAVKGVPIPGIPGYTPPNAIVSFSKSGNQFIPKLEALQGTVHCHGNVDFELMVTENRQALTLGKFTSYGKIYIRPALDDPPGDPLMFYGYLTKTMDDCKIEVIKVNNNNFMGNTMQLMPVGTNRLPIESGGMNVLGDTWDTMDYTCLTTTVDGLNAPGKEPNRLDFTVHGAIAVSGKDIKATGINTPLGALNLTYNFAEGSLLGYMNVKNLSLGYATIFDGEATMRFDNKGFYMLLDMQDFAIGVANGFKGGLLLGKTNGVQQSDLGHVRSNFRYGLPTFESGFAGVYIIGEKVVGKPGLDLVVMEFNADAGLGMSVNFDFQNDPLIQMAGYAYCDLFNRTGFGIPVTGPDCGVWVDAKLYSMLVAEYSGGNIGLNACGSLQFGCGFDDGVCDMVMEKIGLSHLMDIITNQINMKIESGYNSGSGFSVGVTPFATCE